MKPDTVLLHALFADSALERLRNHDSGKAGILFHTSFLLETFESYLSALPELRVWHKRCKFPKVHSLESHAFLLCHGYELEGHRKKSSRMNRAAETLIDH